MGDPGGLMLSPMQGPGATPPPEPEADLDKGWLLDALAVRGISRRRFLGFASAMTALLALPSAMTPQIVRALETK